MPEAMDVASGISPERLVRVREQARTSILGDALNYPMPHLQRDFGVPDLGDRFRAPLQTDVPALFLTGTLDGRTYPEEHAETIAGFSRATHVVVENAGHNLFMVSPEVTQVIVEFMKGRPLTKPRIAIDPPRFAY
jgi:pimeloyl-ACP methyl ester carboxylesterase